MTPLKIRSTFLMLGAGIRTAECRDPSHRTVRDELDRMENDPFGAWHQGDRVPKLNQGEACTEYPVTDASQGQAEAEAIVKGAEVL